MALRTGFYIDNGVIAKYDVEIDWELGFTRQAKNIYVWRLLEELVKAFPDKSIAEVTTASLIKETRMLSPMYIMTGTGESIEDSYKSVSADALAYQFGIPRCSAFPYWYCSHAVHMLPLIKVFDVFCDVFYKPDNSTSTQAEACAMLKLMDQQGNLEVLRDIRKFGDWYREYISYRVY